MKQALKEIQDESFFKHKTAGSQFQVSNNIILGSPCRHWAAHCVIDSACNAVDCLCGWLDVELYKWYKYLEV